MGRFSYNSSKPFNFVVIWEEQDIGEGVKFKEITPLDTVLFKGFNSNEIFQIVYDFENAVHTASKTFG